MKTNEYKIIQKKWNKKYISRNYHDSIAIAKNLLQYAIKSKKEANLIDANKRLAYSYYYSGDNDMALIYLDKAKVLIKDKQSKSYLELLGIYGPLFIKLGQLKKSLNYLQNSLQIAHALNDINFELIILNNLATVYQKLGDVDTAIKYFEECINISEKTNFKNEIYIYYFNIGTIYLEKKLFDKAEKILNKALILSQEDNNNNVIVNCFIGLSALFIEQNKLSESLKFAKNAYKLAENEKLLHAKCNAIQIKCSIYQKMNQFKKVKKLIDEGLTISTQMNDKLLLMDFKKLIITHYEMFNDYKNALIASKDYIESKDKIYSDKIINSLNQSRKVIDQIGHELNIQQREKRILELKQEKEDVNRKLTVKAIGIIKRDEFINSILNDFKNLKNSNSIQKIISKIKQYQLSAKEYEDFEILLQDVNKEFFDKLIKNYPSLSQRERKVCAMIYINMQTKDIAKLTNLVPNSIDHYRYIIRKKLCLGRKDSLNNFLNSI